MRIRKTAILIVVCLTSVFSLGITDTASAAPDGGSTAATVEAPSHWSHPEWAYICASQRPPENPLVEHAHPYYMDANHVRFACNGDTPSGFQECNWQVIAWTGGGTTGPYFPQCELNGDGLTTGPADIQMFRGSPVVKGKPAHQPAGYYIASPTAGFICGATRPDASYEIQYAKPFYYDANHVRYTCIGHRHSPNVVCSWVGIQWIGGGATGHDYNCHPW